MFLEGRTDAVGRRAPSGDRWSEPSRAMERSAFLKGPRVVCRSAEWFQPFPGRRSAIENGAGYLDLIASANCWRVRSSQKTAPIRSWIASAASKCCRALAS
jgi:hypothetical protein